jgi:hypothetical protein
MALSTGAAVSLGLPNPPLVVGQYGESGPHRARDQLPTPAEPFGFAGAMYPHHTGMRTWPGWKLDGARELRILAREVDVQLPVGRCAALLTQRRRRIGAFGRPRIRRGQPEIVADRDGTDSQDCNQQDRETQLHWPAGHRPNKSILARRTSRCTDARCA